MALNDDKERLFNYICDIEEHALPSAQTAQTKLEVQNWLKTQAERRVVLFKDQDGKTTGGLIDLRRKLCPQYLDTGSCRPTGNTVHYGMFANASSKEAVKGNVVVPTASATKVIERIRQKLGLKIFQTNLSEILWLIACPRFVSSIRIQRINAKSMHVRIFTSVHRWLQRQPVNAPCHTIS